MKLYDNAPESYYEESKSYFPRWYADVHEMDAIWHVCGALFDTAQQDVTRVLENAGILNCDYDTVHELEEWLGIRFSSPRTDEMRKAYLLTQIAGLGKCSRTKIQDIIRRYTGAESTVEFRKVDEEGNYGLFVTIDRSKMTDFYLDDVRESILRIMPCHITQWYTIEVTPEDPATIYVATAQTGAEAKDTVKAKLPEGYIIFVTPKTIPSFGAATAIMSNYLSFSARAGMPAKEG